MNHDTPGAVPSDDFPFLGPAVSPRRSEGGAPLYDEGELPGPFVGGTFGTAAGEPDQSATDGFGGGDGGEQDDVVEFGTTPAEGGEDAPFATFSGERESGTDALGAEDFDPLFGGAGYAERLEGSAGGGEDDFPWLIQAEAEAAPAAADEAGWRPTGEVEESAAGSAAEGSGQSGVDHFSWIGESPPREAASEPWEEEGAGAEALGGGGPVGEEDEAFPWDDGAEAEEGGGFGGGYGGFETPAADTGSWADAWAPGEAVSGVPAERAAEPWAEGDDGPAGGAEPGAYVASGEDELAPDAPFDWGAELVEDPRAAAEADRWEGGEGFQVTEQEAAATEPAAAAGGPVEAAPLPVAEWEPAPDDGDVEEEVAAGAAAAAEAPAAGDPLHDVADRLERIAQALRSGRPAEAAEEGDPLQLLITGYALGYAQARRGGR